MNAENPVQIDLFGVSATRTKDTRLAEHIGGSVRTGGGPAAVPARDRNAGSPNSLPITIARN